MILTLFKQPLTVTLHKITNFSLYIKYNLKGRNYYFVEVKKMQIKWKKLIICLLIWLATEILFNLIGIDDLADYSEFVFEPCQTDNIGICVITYK